MSAVTRNGLSRRHALAGLAAGTAAMLLRRSAAMAAGSSSAEAAIASLLAGRQAAPSDRLSLDVPHSFEYGMTVPLGIAVDSPMSRDDHIRRVDVFASGNPLAEVVTVRFAPGSPARASTRFRLDKGDHRIWVVAELSDGSLITASRDVTSATDGCGGKSGIAPGVPEADPAPRVNVPEQAGMGEIIEIATMIAHRMETGFRSDTVGNPLPRRIINRMECRYCGRIVFAASLTPAIAANAYLKFPIRAGETGEMAFAWYEDGGAVYRAARHIAVN